MDKESNPSFVLRALKDVAIEEITKPQIKNPYDVIVQIAQTGICMSDVHYWQRGRIGDFILTSPIVLGHESSGTVTEVGAAVKNLKLGDRVAAHTISAQIPSSPLQLLTTARSRNTISLLETIAMRCRLTSHLKMELSVSPSLSPSKCARLGR
jgi:hypothetical protein